MVGRFCLAIGLQILSCARCLLYRALLHDGTPDVTAPTLAQLFIIFQQHGLPEAIFSEIPNPEHQKLAVDLGSLSDMMALGSQCC